MSIPGSRTFTRVPVHVRAEYRVPGNPTVSGRVEDLSLNGLLLETTDEPEVGAKAAVEIILESGTSEIRIHADAEVRRAGEGTVAFHFDRVHGDDFEHLEKLVLFNAEDARRVEQEMQVHADDQPQLSGSIEG